MLHPTTDTPTTPGAEARATDGPPVPSSEMIGVIDMRLHHPERVATTIGMVMIAEPWQRRGHGRAAWSLVEAWLAGSAGMETARAGVEAFNIGGLRFLEALGFAVTGEATRVPVGERLVRLIYLEKGLTHQ